MDAVGTDKDVAMRGRAMRSGSIEEIRTDAGFILLERAQAVTGVDPAFAEPRTCGLIDHALQAATVNRELGNGVSGVKAARLPPDLLAEAISVDQLMGPNRHRFQAVKQSQLRELADAMRQRVNANAELTNGFRLLVDLAVDSARIQHQGRRQAPHAPARDYHLHDSLPPTRDLPQRHRRLQRISCPVRRRHCNTFAGSRLVKFDK